MKTTRRDFLWRLTIWLGSTFAGIEYLLDKTSCARKNVLEHRIYYELPEHVHIARTITDIEGFGEREKDGCGIIVDGKYLTMAHIILSNGKSILKYSSGQIPILLNVKRRKTSLYGKELIPIHVSDEEDVAVFELPYNLKLPDFPAKPSNSIRNGEEVYVIGNPYLEGHNIRKAYVSRLNVLGEDKLPNGCFSIGKPVISGDSGSPIVSSSFKLLGLADTELDNSLGYVRKIDKFRKYSK
ncbi:MAG: serine protease [Nanoarchaeota archaeon]